MSTKSDVLSILECSRDRTVSGQELANRLGVSRTAVWKAVKALEEDGHVIIAVTNRGYRLAEKKELLSAEGVSAHLTVPLKVLCYSTIDSTNAEAKRLALEGAEHGTVLVADSQTSGRGRFGKSFYSPKTTGLYMSVILRPYDTDIKDAQMITVAAAVVTSQAIQKLTGLRTGIKWVNDLYLGDKKICGILTEAVSDFESGQVECIVVGIGINCATADFPPELSETAGSLGREGLSRNHLAALIAEGLVRRFEHINDKSIIEEYKARSIMLDKTITYVRHGVEHTAVVLDINDRGNLVVRAGSGDIQVISSGEVSIKKWKN